MKLIVQSGPQAGAIETLNAGRWLLGSGEHCDFIVRDAGIRHAHLMLLVDEHGVSTQLCASAQGGAVDAAALDAAANLEPPADWPAGQLLSLGGTTLRWQAEPAAEGLLRDSLASAPVMNRFDRVNRFERSTHWILGGLAGCLLAGVLAAQANRANADASSLATPNRVRNNAGPGADADPAVNTASWHQTIADKLAALNMTELGLEHNADGSAIVTGWVRDAVELGRLRQALAELKVRAHVKVPADAKLQPTASVQTAVIDASEQIRFAGEYLLARGQIAAISYQGDGRLLIRAAGRDERAFRGVVQGLEQVASQVRGIEIDYQTLGSLPASAVDVPVVAATPALSPQVLSGVDGVSLSGRQRFLTSGTHYVFEGGKLADGSTIVRIDRDQIALLPGTAVKPGDLNESRD
jgi:Inner membrane component of T3SS, cytoplasmic domain